MGAAFLAVAEPDVHPAYLDYVVCARAEDTVLTTAFDGGWPDAPTASFATPPCLARRPPGVRRTAPGPARARSSPPPAPEPIHRYDDAQPTRDTTGDVEAMAMYAGTCATAVTRAEPAADIVARLAAGLD
jgi:NAD(P)H-dependent flavin oxidoreductase YrpB (nitropropane dioxygenase family)